MTRRLLWLFGFGLLVGLLATKAHAQQDPSCNQWTVNSQGTSNADITVDSTAGGVTVLAAATRGNRCAALIRNTGAYAMRCGPSSITVSSTVGQTVNAGETLVLGFESYPLTKCIRTTANSTTANVGEVGRGPR